MNKGTRIVVWTVAIFLIALVTHITSLKQEKLYPIVPAVVDPCNPPVTKAAWAKCFPNKLLKD